MKKVIIFGSTGSIGRNALEVIRRDRKRFIVEGLCAYQDVKTLISQVKEFRPSYVCLVDKSRVDSLKKNLPPKTVLFKEEKGLEEFSSLNSHISILAISGISCLRPLLINLKHTKRIALANKESLITAGSFIFSRASRSNTEIIPVDSEINALFQLLTKRDGVDKVYLTASGGSLMHYRKSELKNIGIKEVLRHPTWRMGRRITVDSATLVNKGFEVVETHYFFNLAYNKIKILLHRQSMVHALVELKDKTAFACLYPPDMKIPLSFALYYPHYSFNVKGAPFRKKMFFSFQPLDIRKFPLLKIILGAAGRKDNSLVILNACDELAIDYFLKGKIRFVDVIKVMNYIFGHYPSQKIERIEDIFYWDSWARAKTKKYLNRV